MTEETESAIDIEIIEKYGSVDAVLDLSVVSLIEGGVLDNGSGRFKTAQFAGGDLSFTVRELVTMPEQIILADCDAGHKTVTCLAMRRILRMCTNIRMYKDINTLASDIMSGSGGSSGSLGQQRVTPTVQPIDLHGCGDEPGYFMDVRDMVIGTSAESSGISSSTLARLRLTQLVSYAGVVTTTQAVITARDIYAIDLSCNDLHLIDTTTIADELLSSFPNLAQIDMSSCQIRSEQSGFGDEAILAGALGQSLCRRLLLEANGGNGIVVHMLNNPLVQSRSQLRDLFVAAMYGVSGRDDFDSFLKMVSNFIWIRPESLYRDQQQLSNEIVIDGWVAMLPLDELFLDSASGKRDIERQVQFVTTIAKRHVTWYSSHRRYTRVNAITGKPDITNSMAVASGFIIKCPCK